jgi:uncharacterized protein
MRLTWDENKRQKVLSERGLDFAQAAELFASQHFTDQDSRIDYGEDRYCSVGLLSQRLCVLVWTPRGNAVHVISLRKANDREKASFKRRMG